MAISGFTQTTGGKTATKPKKQITPPSMKGATGGSALASSAFKPPSMTGSTGGHALAAQNIAPPPPARTPPPDTGGGGGNSLWSALQTGVTNAGGNVSGDNARFNNANTDAMTGAMAAYGYTPAGLASIYDNPSILTNDLLQAMGINNQGMANQLGQYMDPAIAAQFILNRGQNSSDNSALNFANEYLQQMVTPGGRQPEMDRMVAEILGSGGSSNLLGQYLNAGLTPDQQVQAANALLGQTLSGQSPYAQTAYQRFEKDQGNKYLGQVAHGDPGATSYIDYLRHSPLAGWVRGS